MTRLKGSEKQVAWAEGIRTRLIKEVNALLTTNKDDFETTQSKIEAAAPEVIDHLMRCDDAKWMIDYMKNASSKDFIGFNYIKNILSTTKKF